MSLCKSYNINIFHVVATLIAWEMKLVKSHFAIPFFSELLFIVLCACEKKENENFFMRLWMMLHNFFFVFWNYVSLFLRSGKQWNFFYFFSLLPSHHHHHLLTANCSFLKASLNIIFLNCWERRKRDLQCSTYFMRLLNELKMDYGISFLTFWDFIVCVCETLNLFVFHTHTSAAEKQQQQL